MKRIVIAAALAFAAGGQALAADLPPPMAPPPRAPATYVPAPVPIFTWTGFYLGINGGYGFGQSDWTAPRGTTGNFNTSGFLVGGTVGGNYQFGSFVVGIEGDFDYNDLNGSTGCGAFTCETKSDWLGTARGRLGYAIDRILIYGTGGAAFTNIQAGFAGGPYSSNTQVGWTGGGGIEAAFTPNWTAKVEYLYVDFSNAACATTCFNGTSVSLTENVIRAGLNYKFGW